MRKFIKSVFKVFLINTALLFIIFKCGGLKTLIVFIGVEVSTFFAILIVFASRIYYEIEVLQEEVQNLWKMFSKYQEQLLEHQDSLIIHLKNFNKFVKHNTRVVREWFSHREN